MVSRENLVGFSQPTLSQRRFPASWLEESAHAHEESEHAHAHEEREHDHEHHHAAPRGTWQFACSVCDNVLTILAHCFEGLVQCANCFTAHDVQAVWKARCGPPPYGSMNPVSVTCKDDGVTLYMKMVGPLASATCECGKLYYYDYLTGQVFERDPIASTGLPPTDRELFELSKLLVTREVFPCDRVVKKLECCRYPWEDDGDDGHDGGSGSGCGGAAAGAAGCGAGGGAAAGAGACPVWVNCPPWRKFKLADLIANCGHGPLGLIPCPPPPECRTVYFVNTGTGSPFDDEGAAKEAAWRYLVEEEGVPQEAIHGCYLKLGTKIKYSATGGPASAEVCCEIDYWCDPHTKKGNLPAGVHCCCPGTKPSKGGCNVPPPPLPPLRGPLPPLRSGAPRTEKNKGRCCYTANAAKGIGITGLAGTWGVAPYKALYLTGERTGDCTGKGG